MEEIVKLLESRLSILETLYVGDGSSDGALSLPLRFQNVAERLDQIDKDIPDIANCRNLLSAITPILTMKRSSLPGVVEKAKELWAMRAEIETHVNSLQAIKTLGPSISEKSFPDADVLRSRLSAVEAELDSLSPIIVAQTREVDAILEIYEQSMIFLNSINLAWDSRLASSRVNQNS